MENPEIKKAVRERYSEIAKKSGSCCGPASPCGCSDTQDNLSTYIGYTENDLVSAPQDSNLGLGCGNPVAIASLKEGEVVLDLGSGAGFDCFLASSKVGSTGKVIGVDMTPEMIEKARRNAGQGRYGNVEFRLGEIESLPVADNYVDVIISNCVINLSPDKEKVFREAFRVLKPGGRLMISDLTVQRELPASIKSSIEAYVGCISGAISKSDYIKIMESAGFKNIEIVSEQSFPIEDWLDDPAVKSLLSSLDISAEAAADIAGAIASTGIYGVKPAESN